jgi:hypothetical protein
MSLAPEWSVQDGCLMKGGQDSAAQPQPLLNKMHDMVSFCLVLSNILEIRPVLV